MKKIFPLSEIDVQSFVDLEISETIFNIESKKIMIYIPGGFSIDEHKKIRYIENVVIEISNWHDFESKMYNEDDFILTKDIERSALLNICQFIWDDTDLELHGYLRDEPYCDWGELKFFKPEIKITAEYSDYPSPSDNQS